MNKETILGIIRHIITFAGGYLVAKGFVASADVEVLAGAIPAVAAIIWSAVVKYKTTKQVKALTAEVVAATGTAPTTDPV